MNKEIFWLDRFLHTSQLFRDNKVNHIFSFQLGLRENDLVSLPKELGDLARLRELHIQGNRLTVLPPELGK